MKPPEIRRPSSPITPATPQELALARIAKRQIAGLRRDALQSLQDGVWQLPALLDFAARPEGRPLRDLRLVEVLEASGLKPAQAARIVSKTSRILGSHRVAPGTLTVGWLLHRTSRGHRYLSLVDALSPEWTLGPLGLFGRPAFAGEAEAPEGIRHNYGFHHATESPNPALQVVDAAGHPPRMATQSAGLSTEAADPRFAHHGASGREDPVFDPTVRKGSREILTAHELSLHHQDLGAQPRWPVLTKSARLRALESLDQDGLRTLAVLHAYGAVTLAQLNTFLGIPPQSLRMQEALITMWRMGLIEMPHPHPTWRNRVPVFQAVGAPAGTHKAFAETWSRAEHFGVLAGQPWTGAASHVLHDVIATELCLRIAEHTIHAAVFGQRLALYTDTLIDPEHLRRTHNLPPLMTLTADGLIVPLGSRPVALEVVRTSKNLDRKLAKLKPWLSATRTRPDFVNIVFVVVDHNISTSRPGGRDLYASVCRAIRAFAHSCPDDVASRVGVIRWTDWFPGEGQVRIDEFELLDANVLLSGGRRAVRSFMGPPPGQEARLAEAIKDRAEAARSLALTLGQTPVALLRSTAGALEPAAAGPSVPELLGQFGTSEEVPIPTVTRQRDDSLGYYQAAARVTVPPRLQYPLGNTVRRAEDRARRLRTQDAAAAKDSGRADYAW